MVEVSTHQACPKCGSKLVFTIQVSATAQAQYPTVEIEPEPEKVVVQ